MNYWVNEDDPTNRVRIHKAACSRCKEGQGMKRARLPDNRWHGPFKLNRKPSTWRWKLDGGMPRMLVLPAGTGKSSVALAGQLRWGHPVRSTSWSHSGDR